MHPAGAFRLADRATLIERLRLRRFCTVAGVVAGRAVIAHAPVLVRDAGAAIDFHLSRRNPLADVVDGTLGVIAQLGDDAYVSPDWYASEDQVPTWNYRLVEAEPLMRLDDEGLVALLDDLSAQEEGRLLPKTPWTRRKMTAGRFEAMTCAIVGFRLTVERLEGVDRLSQNKPAADRAGLRTALKDHPLGALIPKD